MTPSLLRRSGAALLLAAGAFALAPAAHAHSLGYADPSEHGLHPSDDIVAAAVSHWTSSLPTVGPPPVTIEHAITTAGPYGSRPCLEIRTSDRFRVCGTEVKRLSVIGTPTVGTAQMTESPAVPGRQQTVSYRLQLGTIGNPASYEWGAWARNDVSWMYPGDDILDGPWHRHTIRYELSPAPQ
jgi:hypothetical protein